MKRMLFAMLSLFSVMQAGICADVAKPFSLSIPGKATRPVLYFADHDLHVCDTNTQYAVIVIHGVTSGTHDYAYSIRPHLADKYPTLRAPYIIVPCFPFEDLLAKSDFKGYACWKQGCWASGNDSVNAGPVCAYDVVDEVFAKLMDKKAFPNLKHVLLMGFSAGGQFVNRYVAVGKAPQRPGVAVDFAVGSPSSWLYLDDRRPQKDGTFAPLTGDDWKGYNKWHCGLENKDSIRYVKAVSAEMMWKNVTSRHVLCFCGLEDNDPAGRYVANGRTARAEGASRLERLRNYRRYVALFPDWAKQMDFLEIPGVGHKSFICFLDPTIIRLMYGQRSKTHSGNAQAGKDAADGLTPEKAIPSPTRPAETPSCPPACSAK